MTWDSIQLTTVSNTFKCFTTLFEVTFFTIFKIIYYINGLYGIVMITARYFSLIFPNLKNIVTYS